MRRGRGTGAGYPGGIARGGTGRPHQPAGGAGGAAARGPDPDLFALFLGQDPERNSQGSGDHPGADLAQGAQNIKTYAGAAADGINFWENAKIQIVMPVCTAGTAHYSSYKRSGRLVWNFHKKAAHKWANCQKTDFGAKKGQNVLTFAGRVWYYN